jgi:hypothetical protein
MIESECIYKDGLNVTIKKVTKLCDFGFLLSPFTKKQIWTQRSLTYDSL